MSTEAIPQQLINTDVMPVLRDSCAQHLRATLSQPQTGAAIHATFSSVSEKELVFEVKGQGGVYLERLAQTAVAYVNDNGLHVFAAAVAAFNPSATTGSIALTLPHFIIQPELRRFFRVPVTEPKRVQVQMENQGYGVYEPQLMDLSVGGMLIEFPVDQDPKLDLKTAMSVKLQLDEDVAQYLAEVRHTRTGRYGLMFVESPDPGDAVEQAETLRRILEALEQAWR